MDLSVLVIDDDTKLRIAVARALRVAGYRVLVAADGDEALESQRHDAADVLVLDVAMPGIGGLEVCRRLRARGDNVPILVLTALDGLDDRVAGLDAGADDYVVKPFELAELLARLRALLRRSEADRTATQSLELSYGDLSLNTGTREVRRGDRPIELTRMEFALLETFLQNPRQVLTREVITERVWGYGADTVSNSLEVFVGSLRRKTEDQGKPRLIHTVRGIGYVLREA